MPGMMRNCASGSSCRCHAEWMGTRTAEKRQWKWDLEAEWVFANHPEILDSYPADLRIPFCTVNVGTS